MSKSNDASANAKESGEEADIEDLEVEMKINRGGRYDWDHLCDGKVHWLRERQDRVASRRTAFRHACTKRGKHAVTRFPTEHRETIDGVVWGRFYIQAKPDDQSQAASA